jgi:hypothetical protein
VKCFNDSDAGNWQSAAQGCRNPADPGGAEFHSLVKCMFDPATAKCAAKCSYP